ncbi:MAG: DUF2971 domain-containing protein [Bacillota bacterium]
MNFDDCKSLSEVIFKSFLVGTSENEYSGSMYHYTSPQGVLGILQKDEIKFQFTRFDCVNDISEGQDIQKQYSAVCDDLFKSSVIDRDFYHLIKELKPNRRRLFIFTSNQTEHTKEQKLYQADICQECEYEAYICCFSREADSLPMWNYYITNGNYQGYSLGFDDFLIKHYKENDLQDKCGKGVCLETYQVIYNDSEKRQLLEEFILALYKYRLEDNRYLQISSSISGMLSLWQMLFKSSCFAHEKEIRAVMFIPKQIPQGAKKCKDFPIEFRSKAGYIIPYITIRFAEKSYLQEVIIGPLSEQKLSQATVQSLLENRGYRAHVALSKVPIRF